MDQFAVSPCSNPELDIEAAIKAYAALGYRKFELFTAWAASRVDIHDDPQVYRDVAMKYDMAFSSMHLPAITEEFEGSLRDAITGARLAAALGVKVVLYKAISHDLYVRAASRFLDSIEDLDVVPVVQNHVGSPVTTLDDFEAVMGGIDDPRMKSLLEVGMFHTVGTPWQRAYDILSETVALVHIKDQIGERRVPFGEGEVDLEGLFARLARDGYTGDIVIEMEVCPGETEQTLELLGQARAYCRRLLQIDTP
jgi:sugar phosphate isomerase/epimerase